MYVCSEAAVMSGARIVHFCGHDCIPWDLCVQQLAKALSQKDKDETLTEVTLLKIYLVYVYRCVFSVCVRLYTMHTHIYECSNCL